MRMRVIMPDFWKSEHLADLSPFARLLLVALWSYVDDYGVGRDSIAGIAGECFSFDLARDHSSALAAITAGLDELWRAGRVVRYLVGPEKYLEVDNWGFWQKPDRPSKRRLPVRALQVR